jgi:hypothetical protein
MVCLKANNKVRALNVSHNSISNDLKIFKQLPKFLTCNKVLKDLDLSYCNINSKAAKIISLGLQGNRCLEKLCLKGNPVMDGIVEIGKSLYGIKELDVSKC